MCNAVQTQSGAPMYLGACRHGLCAKSNGKPSLSILNRRQYKSNSTGDIQCLWLIAIALIVTRGLGLAYGSFSYTEETQEAKIGPIELMVKDRQTVNIPVWAGVAAIVAGALLLFVPKNS